MKKYKVNLPNKSFPSDGASDVNKKSEEYGIAVGQAIQHEWFKGNGSCRFYDQWDEFNTRRLYARGQQSISKYKNELAIDGDLSYLNLDWSIVPVIPKFVDIVVNGQNDRNFKVSAYSQDAMSQDKRTKYQENIEAEMESKAILEQIQEKTGVNPFTQDPSSLPTTQEELSLHMQLEYKPAIEIAQETAINTVMDENHYDDLRKRFSRDNTILGVSMGKHEFLKGEGVKLSYVDPANVVYSYTEDPHFKDCFYWGEVKTVAMTELPKIDPSLSNDDLNMIAETSDDWSSRYNMSSRHGDDSFYKDSATLLYFNYKTTQKSVYKKKKSEGGASRVIEKDDQFNPPVEMMEENNFEKIEKTIDVWYEGIMVMGTDILIKWEMMENMVRPQSSSQHAMPSYIAVAPSMYKGHIESLVSRITALADLYQITHLKLQQVISRVVPDGVYIDADGINEVDLGTGGNYTPSDALNMFFQTGSVIGRSLTQDGEFNHGKVPIQQLNSDSGASKAQMLIGSMNNYLGMITNVIGLNSASDASSPDSNALVGVQKLAALNSNVATRHLLDASLYTYRTFCEAIAIRVADILEYSDFKEGFANRIGNFSTSILEEIKDLYMYDFGIAIEISPDEEEKAQLEQNIQMALSKSDINLEDAIDIREVRNLKVANQLLKLKRKKKQEKDEEMMMQQQAMQAQQAQQTLQIKAQAEAQQAQLEAQSKVAIADATAKGKQETLRLEAELKLQLMREEFQMNMQLKGVEVSTLQAREDNREKAKSDRISQQNSEQSQLIEQRKNNSPSIKFESNEDSLDGFGF